MAGKETWVTTRGLSATRRLGSLEVGLLKVTGAGDQVRSWGQTPGFRTHIHLLLSQIYIFFLVMIKNLESRTL